jgi:cell wall assembly regulator SMI1
VSQLEASLVAIERHLADLGRTTLLSLLADGIDPDRVRSALSKLSIAPCPDLETLYGWHDGTLPSDGCTVGDISMFPGFYLLSLGDALLNYRAFVVDPRWDRGWLPIFADGGGDFYVIDLGHEGTGAMRHFRIDEAEHPVQFDSLTHMARTLEAGFGQKAFFVSRAGYLDMDNDEFVRIAAMLNPTVAWWQD